ncbi:type II toxin-antitoxin system MqsA family antitoxin [Methylocucumis oryzae]|uniref:type II toxin-antitoxin system MqsA family antitoxin n=1 Tax=Methylocucumis oryzae TaxID=1632867 RepID=UPI00069814BC|nr:type II toxin-antitoxin system MqsA family antitoxin [Methylocucumis oryzae]
MNHQCPECRSTEFAVRSEAEQFKRKGQEFWVEVDYSVCQHCGYEVIFPDQIKRNDCRLRDAWRKMDGLLTGQEILDLRNQLNLTQQDAAKIFGGGINAFSKYERGEVIQSVAMDKLMRIALEFPLAFDALKRRDVGTSKLPSHQDFC